jgi:glycosyltransferase involved in cell wall biosynthesis
MRVAVLDWFCEPLRPATTGLSDIAWDMADHLHALGEDAYVLASYDAAAPSPRRRAPLYRFDRPKLWQRNILGHLMTCLALARNLAKAPRPDVVLAAEYVSAAVVAAYRPSLPVVFTTPGNIYERIAVSNPYDRSTTEVYKLATALAIRRCAGVIAISRYMRDWWIRTGAPSERVAVIPHGTDAEAFRPLPGARSELGIPENEQTILYAGRLSPEKNVELAIHAVAAQVDNHPHVRLRIAGAGPAEGSLRQLASDLGIADRVIFMGWIDRARLPLYYSAADVFLLPAHSEALGRVILEAMACGCFVAAPDVSGPPDVITDGVTGVLVRPHEVTTWRGVLARALDEPSWRRTIAAAARREVEARYAWPVIAGRIRDEALWPAIDFVRRGRTA